MGTTGDQKNAPHGKLYEELCQRFGDDFIPAFNDNFTQAKLFTDKDSIFLPHDSGLIMGREATDARNREASSDRNPKCTEWDVIDIGSLNDEYAYTIFRMHVGFKTGMSKEVRSFSIWRKVDGIWMICRDQYNYPV